MANTAIFETLNCRGTAYERDSFERLMALADDEDMMKKWSAFVKLVDDNELEFSVVMSMIKTFIEPVFIAIVDEDELLSKWSCELCSWDC